MPLSGRIGRDFHDRVCTPGRLRRRGATLPETPPPPAAGDLLSCFAKKVSKEGDPASPVIRCANDSPALLPAGGRSRELALRAHTATPESPACCCAARRLRRALRDRRAFTAAIVAVERARGARQRARSPARVESQQRSQQGLGDSGKPVPDRLLRAAQGSRPRKRTTGMAGSPSLPAFLATQESWAPAGARPGQFLATEGTPGGSDFSPTSVLGDGVACRGEVRTTV